MLDSDDDGPCDDADPRSFERHKARRVADLQASVDTFSNAQKPGRERYVVGELLVNLGLLFNDAELVSVPSKDEPPDVCFRDARFEVKEIYDKGRMRDREFKEALEEAKRATTCSELYPLEGYAPLRISLDDVLREVEPIALAHSERYERKLVATLDLLLYHNLVDVMGLREQPFPDVTALCAQGWRSVSVVMGHRALVFCDTTAAPAFLRGVARQVIHRP
jgi:Putative endonuclease, protein of unknown function (DUF1780)